MARSSLLNNRPFNTPIETGLRSLFLLSDSSPILIDLQRLVYYDYLLVYSGDVENGPPSLHPKIPHRGGGWLVRQKIVENGLNLMFSKELIQKKYDETGILYGSTELTLPFINYLKSDYAQTIKQISKWVIKEFKNFSNEDLSSFMNNHLDHWGAEFDRESIIRGG